MFKKKKELGNFMIGLDEIKRKSELFFEHKINVHIETNDGRFHNGLILEIGSDFLYLHERVVGNTFVLFSEITLIETYKGSGE
jgi:hypothetical protein